MGVGTMVGGGAGAIGGAMAGKGRDKAHKEAMEIAGEGVRNIAPGTEGWMEDLGAGYGDALQNFLAGGGYQGGGSVDTGHLTGGGGRGGGRGRGRGGRGGGAGSYAQQGKKGAEALLGAAGGMQDQGRGIFNEGFGGDMRQAINNQLGGNEMMRGAYDASMNYQKDPGFKELRDRLAGGAAIDDPYVERALEGMLGRFEAGPGGKGGGGGGSFSAGGGAGAPELGKPTNEWMRKELEGAFMDEGNERVAAMFADMDREGEESLSRAMDQVRRAAGGRGRLGSAAMGAGLGRAAEEGMEAMTSAKNALRKGLFDSERDRMAAAVGELNALDQSRLSNAATLGAAGQSAAASRYGADRMAGAQELGHLAGLFGDLSSDRQGGREFGLGLEGSLLGGEADLDMRNLDRAGNLGIADAANKENLIGLGNDSVAGEAGLFGNLGVAGLGGAAQLGSQGIASDAGVKSARIGSRAANQMAQLQRDQYERQKGIIDSLGPYGQVMEALMPGFNQAMMPHATHRDAYREAGLAAQGTGGKGMFQGMMDGMMGGAMVGSGIPTGGKGGGAAASNPLAALNPIQIQQTPIDQGMVQNILNNLKMGAGD